MALVLAYGSTFCCCFSRPAINSGDHSSRNLSSTYFFSGASITTLRQSCFDLHRRTYALCWALRASYTPFTLLRFSSSLTVLTPLPNLSAIVRRLFPDSRSRSIRRRSLSLICSYVFPIYPSWGDRKSTRL